MFACSYIVGQIHAKPSCKPSVSLTDSTVNIIHGKDFDGLKCQLVFESYTSILANHSKNVLTGCFFHLACM